MNYSISASIYKETKVNANAKDSSGNPLPPKYENIFTTTCGFNLKTPAKDGTFTGSEIKAAVKAELKLPDNIKDVKLSAKGKALEDDKPVTSYGVSYSVVLPYVEPVIEKPVVEPITPEVVEEPVTEAAPEVVNETPADSTPEVVEETSESTTETAPEAVNEPTTDETPTNEAPAETDPSTDGN